MGKKGRSMDEKTQTAGIRCDSIGIQTSFDSGIESGSSDDDDCPPEFANVKKSVLAKKLRDAKKAENDTVQDSLIADEKAKKIENDARKAIDNLQDELDELEDENEKLKQALSKLSKDLNKASDPIIQKLQKENERLIVELESVEVTPGIIQYEKQIIPVKSQQPANESS